MEKKYYNEEHDKIGKEFLAAVQQQNISYLEKRIEFLAQEGNKKEVVDILEQLMELTKKQEEKRQAFNDSPRLGEAVIEEERAKINMLGKELSDKYPEEYKRIAYADQVAKESIIINSNLN